MSGKKYYITTPIYYINDVPHIGHAYTTIAADVLARYRRNKGDDVFFLTGTDEHGAKIAEAAQKASKTPQNFVDDLLPKFKEAWAKLNISYDEFFRTTNPLHEKIVQDFVQQLVDNGFVEKRNYEGLYCVGCEKFLKESELVDGKCPDHLTLPVKQSEENYFFKLSLFEDRVKKLIESGELEIGPVSKKNETLGILKQGFGDVSISRQGVTWGVKFPGDENQTIYVWIDALLNYYTATKIYDKEQFWPADLHLIGKDILKFHSIIWPAMLLALELPLPKKIFVGGYINVDGQKMSKSLGNVIDPIEAANKYGADFIRYFLLREFPYGEDGDISWAKIDSRYNEMANNIGNLFQRTISMINRYGIKLGQQPSDRIDIENELEACGYTSALKKIDSVAEESNRYIAEKQPWVLSKEGKTEELTEVLNTVYGKLFSIAEALLPFMPETAEKMKKQLQTLEAIPLFPRIGE